MEWKKETQKKYEETKLVIKKDSPTKKYLQTYKGLELDKYENEKEQTKYEIKGIEKREIEEKKTNEIIENKTLWKNMVKTEEGKIEALNHMKNQKINHIKIKPNQNKKIKIKINAESIVAYPHTIIEIGKNANVEITEEIEMEKGLISEIEEIIINAGAKVKINYIQNFGKEVYGFSRKKIIQKEKSELKYNTINLGGKITTQKIHFNLDGEDAKVNNKNAILSTGKEQRDIEINSHHKKAGTQAKILSNSIAKDQTYTTIRGLIKIEKNAQKSDSDWHSKTLNLGEEAETNTLPTLEIDNNDVNASHGSSIGKINTLEMFYLMSRGLNKEKAKQAIIKGYLEPIINDINEKEIEQKIEQKL